MDYCLVKAINNNVVLVSDLETKEQVVLMAKGIGFNQKTGQTISDNWEERQVFKFWNGEEQIQNISYDKNEIETIVKSVVTLAEKRLSIHSENLYPTLLDHIVFAIDRLNFGVPLENPFSNEISVFYGEEYEIAEIAVEMIRKKLEIDMGNAEAGFIALHLHSIKKDKPIDLSVENVRMFHQIVNMLSHHIGKDLHANSTAVRSFLLSIDCILHMNRNGKDLKMPYKNDIAEKMAESYTLALKILDIIENETDQHLSVDDIGYITIDIEKLRQVNMN
jgi:Transcriptional antiterminator